VPGWRVLPPKLAAGSNAHGVFPRVSPSSMSVTYAANG
jgi:hypothetical protein